MSCVLATNSLSMKSSSFTAVADLAAPAAALRLVLADAAAPWRSRRATASPPRPRGVIRSSIVRSDCVDARSRCGARRRTARGSRPARRGSPRAAAPGRARMSSRSRISVEQLAAYSARILSCSRPVSRCRRRSRIAWAWASRQPIAAVAQAELGGEPVRPGLDRAGARQHRRHARRAPRRAPSARPRASAGRRRRLDQRDDLVDVGQRDGQAFEDVAALARLAQVDTRCGA